MFSGYEKCHVNDRLQSMKRGIVYPKFYLVRFTFINTFVCPSQDPLQKALGRGDFVGLRVFAGRPASFSAQACQ